MSELPPERPVEPPARRRFADRLWSLSTVIAVALAALVIGGLGGAAITTVADDSGRDGRGPGRGEFHRQHPHGLPPGQMRKLDPDRYQEWKMQRGQGQGPWGRDGKPGPPPWAPRPSESPDN